MATSIASEKGNLFMFTKKKDIPLIFFATVSVCIGCIGTPVTTVIYGRIFAKLSRFLLHQYESPEKFLADIRLQCGLIIVLSLGKMVFNWLGVYLWMKFGERQQLRARVALYNSIFTTEHEWFESKSDLMGEVSQINRCIEEFRAGTATAIGSLVSTVAAIISMTVVAFLQSWALTLVIVASSPLMLLCGWYFGQMTFFAAKAENDFSAKASKVLTWNLSSGNIVRLFNGKYFEISKFNKFVDLSLKAFNKSNNAIAANSGILYTLSLLTFVQGFWFGNHMISIGKLKINQVFTCFSSCLLLGTEIALITTVLAYLNRSYAATVKIKSLLEETSKSTYDNSGEYPSAAAVGNISFENVEFKFASRPELILKNVDFSICANQFNYIIGKSGSGKSTIANLLLRFYNCKHGSILIDGHNINKLCQKWISDNITLIHQDAVIFNDSLRNNIAVAALNRFDIQDVPDLLILEAIKFALLDEVVDKLENGINSEVTSKSFSGGQLQRISIARAFVRDTPILILDETFSALDNRNKDQIINNLKNWRNGKTTIVITHEYDYIENDDHVIYLEEGTIKHNGTFTLIKDKLGLSLQKKHCRSSLYKDPEKEEKYDYLCDPIVLQDLELLKERQTSKLVPILSILKYFISTNELKFTLFCGLMASLLTGILSPVFSYFFSRLLSTMVDAAIGLNVARKLAIYSSTLIGIVLLNGVTIYLSTFLLGYVSEAWIVKLRKLAFSKLADQDMSFLNNETGRIGELTALILNDSRDLRTLAGQLFALLLNLTSMILIGVIWSLVAGWKLALVGISFIPLFLLVTVLYSMLMSIFERKYKDNIAKLENQNYSTVIGVKSIFNLNLSEYFKQRFQKQISHTKSVANKRAFVTGFGVSLSEVITASAFGACIYYGTLLISKGEYTQARFIQVITILTFTMTNASMLLGRLPDIARGQRAGTYIMRLINMKPSLAETEGDIVPSKFDLDPVIRFNNANFTYLLKSEMIFQDASFSINSKETVAFVGHSGAGKSTIASLLMRLYHIQNNSIFINNYDINRLDIDWIREKVSIVPQFASFFEGSIKENLVYGILPQVHISDYDLKGVLEAVNMYLFVESLQDGVNTRIGEATVSTLSGGQQQRLSIARALIRKPNILILDECTSSLDPENRKMIAELVKKLSASTTIILITHDTEMMKIASKLILLDQGEVVQEGTFAELAKLTLFKTLVNI